MSAKSYEEFSKEDLIKWIELCQDFFDGKVPDHEHGALYSVYGRLIKFSEMKNNELAALTQRLEAAEAERDALKDASKKLLSFLSITEIVTIDNEEFNLWSVVGDLEINILKTLVKGDE